MSIVKRIIFFLFVAVFPVLVAVNLIFPDLYPVFHPAKLPSRSTLIIDAGHGGEDGGAISVSGASESQINLSIATRIDQIMGLFGAPSVMLRQEDISLHSPQAKTLREKKNSDLHNRTNSVNELQGVLLSIHQNSFPSGIYSGAQVFYAPTDGSASLAEAMQTTLRTAIDPTNRRQATKIPKTVYLMNHVACPAILIECGFLSNPTEDRRLQDPCYQTKLATAITGCWLQFSKPC